MDLTNLDPPNSHLLSDEVVAGAVQCVRRANYSVISKTSNVPTSSSETFHIDGKLNRIETTESISVKLLQGANGDNSSIEELQELVERANRKQHKEIQREVYIASLDNDVQELLREIKMLKRQRRRIPASISAACNDVWTTAMQYFRFFRFGLQPTGDQIAFIRKTMISDVLFNAEYGIVAMVRSWRFFMWFEDMEVELKGLQKTDDGSLVAATKTSLIITEQTLHNVFPHLRISDNRTGNASLAEMLLDQRIVLHGLTCFRWNSERRLVTSVLAQSDMITPILQLLGNLKDVSRVFEHALISPEFQWR